MRNSFARFHLRIYELHFLYILYIYICVCVGVCVYYMYLLVGIHIIPFKYMRILFI